MANDAGVADKRIDPELVADVVRTVIARLQQPAKTNNNAKLITLETIKQHCGKRLIVASAAVVTPAARDEANQRGIVIERTCQTAITTHQTTSHPHRSATVTDPENTDRRELFQQQLVRRGLEIGGATIVLSDTPARELHQQITNGNRAAMITEIADVERFAGELGPTVWVLDMKRLNIPAAVNVAAKIDQLGNQTR